MPFKVYYPLTCVLLFALFYSIYHDRNWWLYPMWCSIGVLQLAAAMERLREDKRRMEAIERILSRRP